MKATKTIIRVFPAPPAICTTPGLHRKHRCYNCSFATMCGDILFCPFHHCLRANMTNAVKRF